MVFVFVLIPGQWREFLMYHITPSICVFLESVTSLTVSTLTCPILRTYLLQYQLMNPTSNVPVVLKCLSLPKLRTCSLSVTIRLPFINRSGYLNLNVLCTFSVNSPSIPTDLYLELSWRTVPFDHTRPSTSTGRTRRVRKSDPHGVQDNLIIGELENSSI